VYFFRTVKDVVSEELDGLLQEPQIPFSWERLQSHLAGILHECYGAGFFSNETEMYFHYGENVEIEVASSDDSIEVGFSEALRHQITQLADRMRSAKGEMFYDFEGDGEKPVVTLTQILTLKSKALQGIFGIAARQWYVLGGRSRFVTHESRLGYLQRDQRDYLQDHYIAGIEEVRRFLFRRQRPHNPSETDPTEILARRLCRDILKGEVKRVIDRDRFFFSETQSLDIAQISSGQQEVLWLANLLYMLALETNQGGFLVIEEPESYLRPEGQFLLCKLIALVLNVGACQVMVNTHSPYIIAAFNNMLLAARVGIQKPELARKALPEAFWISQDRVYAGQLVDGDVEDILDLELDMIALEKLDTVSSMINEEFDGIHQLIDFPKFDETHYNQQAS
jgi:AAA ATPase domain